MYIKEAKRQAKQALLDPNKLNIDFTKWERQLNSVLDVDFNSFGYNVKTTYLESALKEVKRYAREVLKQPV